MITMCPDVDGARSFPVKEPRPRDGITRWRGSRSRRLMMGLSLLFALPGCVTTWPVPPSRQGVLNKILPSSVQVLLEIEGRRFRSNSGVAVAARRVAQSSDCFILTSGHTFARLSGREEVYVLLDRHQGAGTKTSASVLARRETDDLDLALLRVRTTQCAPARLGRPPALGDPVWVVAFPWGRHMTLVSGVVSQVNPETRSNHETDMRLMVDGSVSYGASGGGVYEARTGWLIGLVEGYRTARLTLKGETSSGYVDVPVPGETYVTPLVDIRRFLTETGHADLLEDGHSSAKPSSRGGDAYPDQREL